MFEAILVSTGILLILVIFIILYIMEYYRKKNIHNREKLSMQSNFQQELLRTQLEIQEQTLKIISQEIHDNIGQVLSLAKLNLNTADLDNREELREKITDSKLLVSKAIQDLRDLSKSMNTDNIEAIGIIRAMEYEMEMLRKAGFTTQLDVKGTVVRLEPQKELIIFRIIQEVFNNIIKHSGATTIGITAIYDEQTVKISVMDNGKGFDLTPLNELGNTSFGLGIRNMHNRAKLIGADFNMSSTIGEGTTVSVAAPLNNSNL